MPGATGPAGATGATGPGGGEGWVYGAATVSGQRTAWYTSLNGEVAHPNDSDDERQFTGTTTPYACTMRRLQVAARYVGGTGTAEVHVTLLRNGEATAMSCTLSASDLHGNYTCSSTEAVSIVPGDLVGLAYTQSNPGPALRIGVGSACQ